MLCPRRAENPGIPGMPTEDHWVDMPNGDKTCSYCGSLSEEDFIRICEEYLKDTPGFWVDTMVDKSYKVYANGPDVQNASQGGIKFYKMHVDKSHPDFQKRVELFKRVSEKCRDDFNGKYGKKSN